MKLNQSTPHEPINFLSDLTAELDIIWKRMKKLDPNCHVYVKDLDGCSLEIKDICVDEDGDIYLQTERF